jgi:cytidylate kinase
MIIALDGPAASGKGTLAKLLAEHFSLPHLDTGLLYRAVGFLAHHGGATREEEIAHYVEKIASVLDNPLLRTREAGEWASKIAALPLVRQGLLKFQQEFAAQQGGAVLDGRDIGTVIAPHADVKLFITASPQERANRRYKELLDKGEGVTYEDILSDILKRDERDSNRAAAPLIRAKDAILLDTTLLNKQEAFEAALKSCVTAPQPQRG